MPSLLAAIPAKSFLAIGKELLLYVTFIHKSNIDSCMFDLAYITATGEGTCGSLTSSSLLVVIFSRVVSRAEAPIFWMST